GIIQFVGISIRKKGRPEIAFNARGMCHTKQMANDQLFKGAQGNFIADRFINVMATYNPNLPKGQKRIDLEMSMRSTNACTMHHG
ncbi:MAG: hypothetical protein ABJA70_20335, partial [Chryseolinea sp.]